MTSPFPWCPIKNSAQFLSVTSASQNSGEPRMGRRGGVRDFDTSTDCIELPDIQVPPPLPDAADCPSGVLPIAPSPLRDSSETGTKAATFRKGESLEAMKDSSASTVSISVACVVPFSASIGKTSPHQTSTLRRHSKPNILERGASEFSCWSASISAKQKSGTPKQGSKVSQERRRRSRQTRTSDSFRLLFLSSFKSLPPPLSFPSKEVPRTIRVGGSEARRRFPARPLSSSRPFSFSSSSSSSSFFGRFDWLLFSPFEGEGAAAAAADPPCFSNPRPRSWVRSASSTPFFGAGCDLLLLCSFGGLPLFLTTGDGEVGGGDREGEGKGWAVWPLGSFSFFFMPAEAEGDGDGEGWVPPPGVFDSSSFSFSSSSFAFALAASVAFPSTVCPWKT
mmetsp:Transcript_8855/g.17300  ORF Transcript_8855/g.17300 Transcript_8855/m.17300 type:complete len:393 (-) Transcript_8855:464-1642(-)